MELRLKVDDDQAVRLKNLNKSLILVGSTVTYIKYAFLRTEEEKYGRRKKLKTRKVNILYAAEFITYSQAMRGIYTMNKHFIETTVRGYNLYECREKYLSLEKQILELREEFVKPKEEKNEIQDRKNEGQGKAG